MARNMRSVSSSAIADAAEGVHEAVFALLASQTPGRLLDAPAGEGAFALQARERGYEVVCGDICPSRFRVKDMKCQYVDLNQSWGFESGWFDCVVSVEAIEHLENPWHLLREASRVLKPGGILILTTPNILSIRSRLSYLLYGYPNYFHYMIAQDLHTKQELPLDHINPIGFLELRHILARNGFYIEHIAANRLLKRNSLFFALVKRLMQSRGHSHVRDNQAKVAVRDILFSEALLFGEVLIMRARKVFDA